jgi:hypothetical protein
VQQISGFPGRRISTWSKRRGCSTIKLVLTRHKQAAVFMAATHGQAGVCLSTLGADRLFGEHAGARRYVRSSEPAPCGGSEERT